MARARPGGWATEIFGSEGAIRIQTGEWLELTSSTRSTRYAATDERHFEREIDEFVTAIAEARRPSVSAEDGRASLRVALAVYAAAEAAASVTLPRR